MSNWKHVRRKWNWIYILNQNCCLVHTLAVVHMTLCRDGPAHGSLEKPGITGNLCPNSRGVCNAGPGLRVHPKLHTYSSFIKIQLNEAVFWHVVQTGVFYWIQCSFANRHQVRIFTSLLDSGDLQQQMARQPFYGVILLHLPYQDKLNRGRETLHPSVYTKAVHRVRFLHLLQDSLVYSVW